MKAILKVLIKLTLGLALCYWLYRSERIEFSAISTSLTHAPQNWLFALLLCPIIYWSQSYRLKKLLELKSSRRIPVQSIFFINWIGAFFSSLLPGTISGDFFRAFYLKDEDQALSTKFVFTCIIIDRISGAYSLLTLVILAGLFLHISGADTLQAQLTLYFHISCALGVIAVAALLFFYRLEKWPRMLTPGHSHSKKNTFLAQLHNIHQDLQALKPILPLVYFLSLLPQTLFIVIFWLITHFIAPQLSLVHYLAIAPIGFFSMAIPLAPAGIGVGHFAFQGLFHAYAVTQGATIFNTYLVFLLSLDLGGIAPFLLKRKKKSQHSTL